MDLSGRTEHGSDNLVAHENCKYWRRTGLAGLKNTSDARNRFPYFHIQELFITELVAHAAAARVLGYSCVLADTFEIHPVWWALSPSVTIRAPPWLPGITNWARGIRRSHVTVGAPVSPYHTQIEFDIRGRISSRAGSHHACVCCRCLAAICTENSRQRTRLSANPLPAAPSTGLAYLIQASLPRVAAGLCSDCRQAGASDTRLAAPETSPPPGSANTPPEPIKATQRSTIRHPKQRQNSHRLEDGTSCRPLSRNRR
jgi:hypothetical protein